MRGVVTEFDEARCLGTVTAEVASFPFHGVVIADGSRAIEPGTEVEFEVTPKLGRYEATNIRRVSGIDGAGGLERSTR
jgi:cold shock CspA family protein